MPRKDCRVETVTGSRGIHHIRNRRDGNRSAILRADIVNVTGAILHDYGARPSRAVAICGGLWGRILEPIRLILERG